MNWRAEARSALVISIIGLLLVAAAFAYIIWSPDPKPISEPKRNASSPAQSAQEETELMSLEEPAESDQNGENETNHPFPRVIWSD